MSTKKRKSSGDGPKEGKGEEHKETSWFWCIECQDHIEGKPCTAHLPRNLHPSRKPKPPFCRMCGIIMPHWGLCGWRCRRKVSEWLEEHTRLDKEEEEEEARLEKEEEEASGSDST